MSEPVAPRLSARLWPQAFGILHLDGEAGRGFALPPGESGDAPSLVLRQGDKVTVIAPVEELGETGVGGEPARRWRAVSLDGVAEAKASIVLKEATSVLSEAGAAVLAVATGSDLLLLVPEELLGRALSALAQAKLERLA